MIVLAIIALLLGIALPAYDGLVTRSKLRSGTESLSAFRGLLEQSYQENRDYRDEAETSVCGITTYTSDYFALSCSVSSRTEYTLTATSLAGVGKGGAGDYVYTINQDGEQKTTRFAGESVDAAYWKFK